MKIVSTSLKFGETSVQMGTGRGQAHNSVHTDSRPDSCEGYFNITASKLKKGGRMRYCAYPTNLTPDGRPIPWKKGTDRTIPGIARSCLKYCGHTPQNTLTNSMLRPGMFDTPREAAEKIRADMVERKIPGITILSPLLMKTCLGKQQDSPFEFQWKWREKNLAHLAEWERQDPRNIRFKFPGFETMEHYDRTWVLGDIVTSVGEVDLNRIADTHSKLQDVHRKARGH